MPLTLADSQFGIIDDAFVCPSSGLFDNSKGYILSAYFCQGGVVFLYGPYEIGRASCRERV